MEIFAITARTGDSLASFIGQFGVARGQDAAETPANRIPVMSPREIDGSSAIATGLHSGSDGPDTLMNPVGDDGQGEVQISVLAMTLGLLVPGEQPCGLRADCGQLADLCIELRQRDQVVLGSWQQQEVLLNGLHERRSKVQCLMTGRLQVCHPSAWSPSGLTHINGSDDARPTLKSRP
jgi:hypothetical protein